jgi:excisionase family DNA binding protein
MAHTGTRPDTGGQTDSLLTIADLAVYLNTSRSTIYRLIRQGSLRPIYFNDRPRFLAEDVWEFVQSRKGLGAGLVLGQEMDLGKPTEGSEPLEFESTGR